MNTNCNDNDDSLPISRPECINVPVRVSDNDFFGEYIRFSTNCNRRRKINEEYDNENSRRLNEERSRWRVVIPEDRRLVAKQRGEERQRRKMEGEDLVFALTNARSLWNKMVSLSEHFDELDICFAIITETWFHAGPAMEELVESTEYMQNMCLLNRMRRKTGTSNPGGGVSIAYDKNKIKMKEYSIKRKNYEILCGRGKFINNTRPVFVLGVYIPPKMKAEETRECLELLSGALLKIKSEARNPYIFLGGDFNHADITEVTGDYVDMKVTNSGPTRQGAFLDRLATNVDDEMVEVRNNPPLMTPEGQESDHRLVTYKCKLKHSHDFKWVTYTYRQIDDAREAEFDKGLEKIDWSEHIKDNMNLDQRTQTMHDVLMGLVNRCFPIRSNKVRSTDDPWIDEATRKAIQRRKQVYYDFQRAGDWKELKATTADMIKRRKTRYYEREVNRLAEKGSHTIPFKALKNISEKEKAPVWTVRSIRPDMEPAEQAEDLADFFAKISNEHPPLDKENLPRAEKHREIVDVTVTEVCSRLVHLKKPKSAVSIDPPTRFVNKSAHVVAVALTPIVNAVRRGEGWPAIWRQEEVSVIPKTGWPESYDQCRNVSCTSIYSKLCESFLLDQLYEEIEPEPHQYGGLKGRSGEHLLAELVTEVMENLDDNRAATAVTSIDLSKAFNRMEHRNCIQRLVDNGATQETVDMVVNFLTARSMRVKMGNGVFSEPRRMSGGAPQGTKTGGFLFCLATRGLDERPEITQGQENGEDTFYTPPTSPDPSMVSSPLGGYSFDARANGTSRRIRDTSPETSEEGIPLNELRISQRGWHERPPRWEERPLKRLRFIDDLTAAEKVDITAGIATISTRKEERVVHARGSQEYLETIKENAEETGMKVNEQKTQALCITTAINYQIRSCIDIDGQAVESMDSLKVLGFVMGRRPGAAEHVKHIRKKYGSRAYSIRHLKKSGTPNRVLVEVYKSFIRPVFDYAAPAYHTVLTAEQAGQLERLQRATLKTIYGLDVPYSRCLEEAGLETLEARRQSLFENFATRAYENEFFKERWFTKKQPSGYGLRREQEVVEEPARCDRLVNAPIYQMRKYINETAARKK